MLAYETATSDAFYFYKNGKLADKQESGSICLLAPGDIAWKSDVEALRLIMKGNPKAASLNSIAAKYLINDARIS
jgi:hypothetical protein